MAAALLILQQAFYASHALPVYIIVGAIVYVSLIRLLKALDKKTSNFWTKSWKEEQQNT
jgi:hypothetical protein